MVAPTVPSRPASLTDGVLVSSLYGKATREYVNREFDAALATVQLLRGQGDGKARQQVAVLEIAILEATRSEALTSGEHFADVRNDFDGAIPNAVLRSLTAALCRHARDRAGLQDDYEQYLAVLAPDTPEYEYATDVYALHVLPACQGWDEARGFVDALDVPEEKRVSMASSLSSLRTREEELEARRVAEQEAEQARLRAEAERRERDEQRRSQRKKAVRSVAAVSPVKTEPRAASPAAPPAERAVEKKAETSFISRLTSIDLLRWHPNTRILQLILFLCLLFGAAGRREIRERVLAALAAVGRTITMGTKVSYL